MIPNPVRAARTLILAGLCVHSGSMAQSSSFVLWGKAQITDRPIVSAAAGTGHFLAIKEGGQVIAWGYWGLYGRGNQYPANPAWPTQVPGNLGPALAVAAGDKHSLALLQDGSVRGWGDNTFGQIAVPSVLKGVKSIEAREDNSLLILADGKLMVLGDTANGLHHLPQDLPPLRQAVLTTYADAIAALTVDGEVVIWGRGYASGSWKKSGTWGKAKALAAGYGFVLALNEDGSLGIAGDSVRKVLSLPDSLGRVGAIAASNLVAAALTESEFPGHACTAWGESFDGSPVEDFGLGVAEAFSGTKTLLTLSSTGKLENRYRTDIGPDAFAYSHGGYADRIRSVSIHERSAAMVNDSGRISIFPILGGDNPVPVLPDSVKNAFIHSTAVRGAAILMGLEDGRVAYAGDALDKFGPNAVPKDQVPVLDLKAGYYHAVALKANGQVHCWDKYNSAKRMAVPEAAQGAKAVAAGDLFSLALKPDGSLVAWGDTANLRIAPGEAQGLQAISATSSHAMGLKRDGTVIVWGPKSAGSMKVPAGLDQVKSIAMGWEFAAALKQDGSVVAWGGATINDFSQSDTPGDLQGVEAIFAGPQTLMAVTRLGASTVRTWTARDGKPQASASRKPWIPTLTYPARDRNTLGRYRPLPSP